MFHMDLQFWRDRWREGRIGFHEGRPNAMLERHLARLGERRRVLVPLCGKAEDLAFLAAAGHEVVGVELVEAAARAFFAGHEGIRGVEIIVGDYFAVTPERVGPIDALYDRAALIALPAEMRAAYVEHTRRLLAPGSPGLLVAIEYAQDRMDGPPFSVPDAEVRALWPGAELLEEAPGNLPRAVEAGVAVIERIYAV